MKIPCLTITDYNGENYPIYIVRELTPRAYRKGFSVVNPEFYAEEKKAKEGEIAVNKYLDEKDKELGGMH